MKVGVAYDACIGKLANYFSDFHIINLEEDKLSTYDLIIFTGGEDINPRLYGERITESFGINDRRDTIETNIWERYVNGEFKTTTKVLGICRGFQFLFAKYGGRLYQDLDSRGVGHKSVHQIKWKVSTPFDFLVNVNSLHHQGAKPSEVFKYELNVLGIEPITSIVEAYVSKSNKTLGIQFHPEFFSYELGKPFFDVITKWCTNTKYSIGKFEGANEPSIVYRKNNHVAGIQEIGELVQQINNVGEATQTLSYTVSSIADNANMWIDANPNGIDVSMNEEEEDEEDD